MLGCQSLGKTLLRINNQFETKLNDNFFAPKREHLNIWFYLNKSAEGKKPNSTGQSTYFPITRILYHSIAIRCKREGKRKKSSIQRLKKMFDKKILLMTNEKKVPEIIRISWIGPINLSGTFHLSRDRISKPGLPFGFFKHWTGRT